MILTSEQTVRAVRTILEEQVLPALATADWTASNVRACLLLLTYAEDCVREERPLLIRANTAMHGLLQSMLDRGDLGWVDDALRSAISNSVAQSELTGDLSVATLVEDHLAKKALLSTIISRAAEARASAPAASDMTFRAELHQCLRVMEECDAKLTARARTMLPI